MTQYIYSEMSFKSPFIVTYVSTSLFLLYLPTWKFCRNYLNWFKDHPWKNDLRDDSFKANLWRQFEGTPSHVEIIQLSCILSMIWFISNCLYSYSLLWTTISNSTIMSNLSSVFTLLFSYLAGIERITSLKVVGVLLCVCGVVLVTLNDADNSPDQSSVGTSWSVVGDFMALLSAFGYGLYTTYLKFKVPDEEVVNMQLILGYLGIVTAVTFLPVLLILIYCHVDSLSNFTALIFLYLCISGLFDYVISDYLWARAVILTSPTVATVGLSLTIPFAFLADVLLHGVASITSLEILGSLLVMAGFVLVNVGYDGNSAEECAYSPVRQLEASDDSDDVELVPGQRPSALFSADLAEDVEFGDSCGATASVSVATTNPMGARNHPALSPTSSSAKVL
jgi:solute carrier family 35, member F5